MITLQSGYVPRPANATVAAPSASGWGGVGLWHVWSCSGRSGGSEAAHGCNSTFTTSAVFANEKASTMEMNVIRMKAVDPSWNAIRASWQPTTDTSNIFHCNATTPNNTSGSPFGFYNWTSLSRAISIAQYYNLYIVLDYHAYNDMTTDTSFNCLNNAWNGVSANLTSSYGNLIYEPLNEPYRQKDKSFTVAMLSSRYQTLINTIRSHDSTHWIVAQNLCSFGCDNHALSTLLAGYPSVTDSGNKILVSYHPYYSYSDFHASWDNASAEAQATIDYQSMILQTTGWPALNTEGGAFSSNHTTTNPPTSTDCKRSDGSSDRILKGSAGYCGVSLHFVQTMTANLRANSIGFLWWPIASWSQSATPGAGTYGALSPNNGWGTRIGVKHFPVFAHVVTTTKTVSELTVPESEQRVFQNPRGQHGYYAFYRDELSTVGACYYATSFNGGGWSAGQSIGLSDLYDTCGVTYREDSANSRTLVYLVASRHSTSVGTNRDIKFRIGSIADSAVSLTWLTSLIAIKTSNSSENLGYPAIAQDPSGYLHVAFSYTKDTSGTANDKQNVQVCSSTTSNPSSNPSWVCSDPTSNSPFPVQSVADIVTPVAMPHVLPLSSGILVIKGVCSGAEANFITCSLGSDVVERSAVLTWNGSVQTWGNTASFTFVNTNPRAEVRTSSVNDTGSFRVHYAYEDGGNLITRYIDSPYTGWSSATTACSCSHIYGAHFTHLTGSVAFERFILFYSTGFVQFNSVNATDNEAWRSPQLEYLNGTTDSDYPTSANKVIETSPPGTTYIPIIWVQAATNREIWFDKRPLN